MRVDITFRGVLGVARKTGVSSKTHCPEKVRVPWPPSLYGKVGLRTLHFHENQRVTKGNFSLARAARTTVCSPRLRKHTRIRGGNGLTTMAFSEAADSPPLPAGISHMGDSKMPCSPILVRPSIAGPASSAEASIWYPKLCIVGRDILCLQCGLGWQKNICPGTVHNQTTRYTALTRKTRCGAKENMYAHTSRAKYRVSLPFFFG